MLLALAAILPTLFWDAAPETAPALREAGITHILVPAARLKAWRDVAGVSASLEPDGAIKLPKPAVNYRMDEASASRAPWLVSNGWQFLRRPQGNFYYDAPGKPAALAAAEAFCYGAKASIHTDSAGLVPLAQMLDFLRRLGDEVRNEVSGGKMPAVADIGFLDDGSPAAGEVMNLMVRDNLLFRIVSSPDPLLRLNVRLGTREYPLAEAKNPGMMAHAIRTNLTDERRSLRIYGSLVVVARVTQSPTGVRIHLLNYAGADRKVDGLRIRVAGRYPTHRLAAADSRLPAGAGEQLLDYTVEADATEFTLPELKTYTVIDLSR